jgi:hypothetical protein
MNYVVYITGERETNAFDGRILSDICKLIDKVDTNDVEFIFNDCTGVDNAALRACNLLKIKYKVYVTDCKSRAKIANPTKNKQMIDYLISKRDTHKVQIWAYHTDYKK